VLCGHIHTASIRQIDGTTYYNCGDWVESCTAMVEHYDGRMELIHFDQASESAKNPEREPAGDPEIPALTV
jgi:hypothetical protein